MTSGESMHADAARPTWISDVDALERLIAGLERQQIVAFDTEADSFHAYRPRLCLLQLCWHEEGQARSALVDTLALHGRLDVLGELFGPDGPTKLVHGADYDVRLLKRDAGIAPKNLFDTQIGARLLGLEKTGLAALAERYVGKKISKSGQRTNWAKRPLDAAALRYATDDVAILFGIAERVRHDLDRLQRLSWHLEECQALEAVDALESRTVDVESAMGRISGAGRLDPRARGVLHALTSWRENEAARRNVPAVHLLPPKVLLALAQRFVRANAEFSDRGLKSAGVPTRTLSRYRAKIVGAIREGLEHPREKPRSARGAASVPADPELLDRLKVARARRAEDFGIEPGTLCSNDVLKAIAREQPIAIDDDYRRWGMRSWQRAALGDALEQALRA